MDRQDAQPDDDAKPAKGAAPLTDIASAQTIDARAERPISSLRPVKLADTLFHFGAAAEDAPDKPAPNSSTDFDLRYTERHLLGEGGMGEVKLSSDERIGRDIAMKVIRGVGRSADAEARFVREARVQGQLEHPSVVPVYDLGADPNGDLYFTMKRIRGRSLAEILEGRHDGDDAFRAQYSTRKLLSAFNSACLTTAFAHARGVLHRDLKPANIMLGDFGEVYVLDWGLAKIRGVADLPADETITDTSHQSADATMDGDILGTPGYMAPEQLAGRSNELDERADVYALGAILYEILTGQRAHQGNSVNALVLSTLSPVAPASERAKEAVAPELDRLCSHALAVAPDERLESASEFSKQLESFLDGDRDLALRRVAAEHHAKRAAKAFNAADENATDETGTDEASRRSDAMREVGVALGLDPTNEDALHTLYRLLTEPPTKMPVEARAALDQARLQTKRVGLKVAMFIYSSFAALVPFVLYMGVKSWVAFAAVGLSIAGCFFLSAYHLVYDRTPQIPFTHLFASTLNIMVSTVILGPFMLLPTLAVTNTTAYAMAAHERGRWYWIVACGVLAFVVPTLLQIGGVLPSTFDVVNGEIITRSLMFDLSYTSTVVFLFMVNVPMIVGAGWFIAKVKGTHAQLEAGMRVQTWQLAQIVPEHLRDAVV